MTDKFLISVGDVRGYDSNQNMLFVAKALLDSSFEMTLGNTPIRGGKGNQLQYIYYHTSEVKITLTDTQWNLNWLALNAGNLITTGANVYTEETVTLVASAGSVTGTPIAVTGSTVYGWVTHLDGTVERVTFSTKSFTCASGGATDTVCVRYFATDSAASQVEIPANVIPSQIRLEIDTQLASNSGTTNIIGSVQIQVPVAQASGAFTLSTKSDGVSTTPLTLTALATSDTTTASCTSEKYYARIIEIVDSANWYDDVVALGIQGGDFALAHPATRQLVVWATPSASSGKAPFQATLADLSFVSSDAAKATVGAHTGLVTSVAAGTTTISVTITGKPSIDAAVVCTVS
jgi:hypothetical protein